MNKRHLKVASSSLNVQEVMAVIFIAFYGSTVQDFERDGFSAVYHQPKSTKAWGFRIPQCPQAIHTVMQCLTSVAALGFTENLDLCFIQPFSLFCALHPQEGCHPGCLARIS